MIFSFDGQLIEETVGKLQQNKLTVDNLTVEWLKNKLNELEASLKECQSKIKIVNESCDGEPNSDKINENEQKHEQNEFNRSVSV